MKFSAVCLIGARPGCAFRALLAVGSLLGGCFDGSEDGSVAPLGSGTPPAAGAPRDDVGAGSAAPTHSGLVSVQEIAVLGQPGGGLTVQALLTPASPPDYEERPGDPTGCKAWSYDLEQRAPPPEQDHGTLRIGGLVGGALACRFVPERGYVCAPSEGDGGLPMRPFLTQALGEGPVLIGLDPAGARGFTLPDTPVPPGAAFIPSDATRALMQSLPLTGEGITLGCAGEGGHCRPSPATIVRITTTDGPTDGLPPTAMPRARRRYVEISCAVLGADEISIPAAAMALLRAADQDAAITRVRTALMRDGVVIVTNAPPSPPNRMVLAVGHGVLGFTSRP